MRGEQKTESVSLDRRAFAYHDTIGKQWNVEPGSFTIFVSSSEKTELLGKVTLSESDIGAWPIGSNPPGRMGGKRGSWRKLRVTTQS